MANSRQRGLWFHVLGWGTLVFTILPVWTHCPHTCNQHLCEMVNEEMNPFIPGN